MSKKYAALSESRLKDNSQVPLRYRLAGPLSFGQQLFSVIVRRRSNVTLRILLFHHLTDQLLPGFDEFIQHVMTTHEIVGPSEAESILMGNTAPEPGRMRILLTFDDGFQSQAVAAEKVLDRYGLKAIFFVCPGLMNMPVERQKAAVAKYVFDEKINGSPLWETKLMSWSQAESLLVRGHAVGSHTSHHRRLTELGRAELEAEVRESGEMLERRLGVPIQWFAYPFGDIESIDSRAYEWIRRRYRFSCSGIRGINSVQTQPLALLRDCIDPSAPSQYQDFVLRGGLDFFYRKRAARLGAMAERKIGERETAEILEVKS